MYKKIKNGSFMNWIWFIICLMPILLLIIYSISFFNREEDSYIYQTQYETIKRIDLNNEQSFIEPLTKNFYVYDYIQDNNIINEINNIYTIENGNNGILIAKNSDLDTLMNNYIYVTFIDSYSSTQVAISGLDANDEMLDDINTTLSQYDILCFNASNFKAILITTTDTYSHRFKVGMYENDIVLNPINPKLINENGYVTIKNFKYNNVDIELPTYKLYENDYIDFENGIYTQNGTQYIFKKDIKLEENKTFSYELEQYQYKAGSGGTTQKTYDYYNNGDLTINRINNVALSNNHITMNVSNNTSLNIESEIITTNITNYDDYLQSINNTLKTNGFISNAFLNLSQFFGVTNVYYSLACYYIEYLLVIVLLHLAFDILYMLPNICHKFMEKIGGERD